MSICRDIIVDVTQEDIYNGEKESAEKCPIALALNRQIPNAMVMVCECNDSFIDIYLGDWHKTWKSSKAVLKFVDNFDEGKLVKPHRFYLRGGTQRYITFKEMELNINELFTDKQLNEMYCCDV